VVPELPRDTGRQRVVVRGGLILALLAAVAGGCFGGSSSAPSGKLRVDVVLQQPCPPNTLGCIFPGPFHYRLTCNPTGGTMPNPAAACAALDDLTTHQRMGQPCRIVMPRITSWALVRGTYAGKPLRLKLVSAESWCGQPASVEKDYWILSTFPCSTVVLHLDNGDRVYADWARKSGCTGTGSSISLSRVG
jgi:hypothetical protein